MRLRRYPHLSSPGWWLKLGVSLSAVLGSMALFASHFTIGVNISECVPERFFLVSRDAPAIERGRYYAFTSRGAAPFFADGTLMLKRLVGVPGDRVTVGEGVVAINGEVLGDLRYATRVDGSIERDELIPEGHYWLMGTTLESFDSRYWGYVRLNQIRSQAWPVL